MLHLDFSGGVAKSPDQLRAKPQDIIRVRQEGQGIRLHSQSLSGRLEELLRRMHQTAGQKAAVLVDEYDKPILDNIAPPEIALDMREQLKEQRRGHRRRRLKNKANPRRKQQPGVKNFSFSAAGSENFSFSAARSEKL